MRFMATSGCELFEINPNPTGGEVYDYVIAEPATRGVAEFLRLLGMDA